MVVDSEAKAAKATELSGSYHGSQEEYGRAFFVLTLVEGAVAMAMPWLDLRFVAKHSGRGHHIWLALATDLLCFGALLSFHRVYKGLSRQIARGESKASTLDSLRLSLTTAASSAAFAWISLHMCGALITK